MVKDQAKSFLDKLTDAIPKWALGILGVFAGVILTLQATGYNGSAQRVIEAYVKQIERNTSAVEGNTKALERLTRLEAVTDDHGKRIVAVEKKVDTLDKENAQVHKGYRAGLQGK